MTTNLLYPNKDSCCGCSSCVNSCPRNAIAMARDQEGFLYPEIDSEKCVDCGLCLKSCAFQHMKETNHSLAVYAAVRKDREKLKQSASGGMFAAIAERIIDEGGIAFGCSMEKIDGKLYPMHVKAESYDELLPILGSKYVQSDVGSIFQSIKKELSSGRKVLFCGTPCQVAGLKGFLKKDWDNLFLLDLVCHGVSSPKMFQDYIDFKEQHDKIKIESFHFRAKTDKPGKWAKIDYTDKKGQKHSKYILPAESSFYYYFLKAQIGRRSCFHCPYTCENRPGDLSIGDFWGFEKKHTDYDKNQFHAADGISFVSANTPKGTELLNSMQDDFSVYPSDFDTAAENNPHLRTPSTKGEHYDLIMETYKAKGYAGVEKIFANTTMKYRIKKLISILTFKKL